MMVLLCQLLGARASVTSTHGMAVSTNHHASDIGAAILARGGNAIDAAIAMQFALSVVEPVFVGPFDGCNIMFYNATTGLVYNLDGREEAPELFHGNIWCQDEGCMTNSSCSCDKGPFPVGERETGGLGFGVPGCMAAVKRLIDEGRTTLSLPELVQPAVYLARKGFTWDRIFHGMVLAEAKYLAYFNTTAEMYLKPDRLTPKVGVNETFRNPELADLMLQLAAPGGIEDMYNGSLARLLVETANRAVNKITKRYSPVQMSDFASYRAVYRAPTVATYRGKYAVHGPALPYSGGVSLAQMLNWADEFDLSLSPSPSPTPSLHQYKNPYKNNASNENSQNNQNLSMKNMNKTIGLALGVLLDAQNSAFSDRDYFLGDADFVDGLPDILPGLLNKSYTRDRIERLFDRTRMDAVKVVSRPEYYC